jgi:hypothetical protein
MIYYYADGILIGWALIGEPKERKGRHGRIKTTTTG